MTQPRRKRKQGTPPPQSYFSRIPEFDGNTLDIGGRRQRCSVSGLSRTIKGQDHEVDAYILRGKPVGKGDTGFIDLKPSVLRAEALLHTDLVEPGDRYEDKIEALEAENKKLQDKVANLLVKILEIADV